MDLSIVIPLYNEEESLFELSEWIKKSLANLTSDYEVLFIDDGSKDKSWEVIEEISRKDSRFKGIKFRRNYGKSAGLNSGFSNAKGNVVFTMDADLQDSPEEIPEIYKMLTENNFDIVSGWKKNRHDPISKTLPTKLFNWATRRVSGIKLHDFNCGLKGYKKEVIKNIEIYGEMHRYIPVIAKWAGFKKITEKPVMHQKRKFGVTKFGWSRFMNGFLDLLSIVFVTRFQKYPMHFFGTMGFLSFLTGFFITLWMLFEKMNHIYSFTTFLSGPVRDITQQPLFYVALVMLIIGVQLFLAGFLGEMISRSSPDRNNYQIEKKTF